MSRRKVAKNIAYDDVKKKYYVTLYFGIGEDGKPIKSTKSVRTSSEAKRVLKEHEASVVYNDATPPNTQTLAEYIDTYVDYRARSLEVTTIYGYTNIANHVKRYFRKKKLQQITGSGSVHPMPYGY